MNPETITCSLNQAKAFKKLHLPQKSFFWWHEFKGKPQVVSRPPNEKNKHLVYSAYTVAEMGYFFQILSYQIPLFNAVNGKFGFIGNNGMLETFETEALTRGKMLVDYMSLLKMANPVQFNASIAKINDKLNYLNTYGI